MFWWICYILNKYFMTLWQIGEPIVQKAETLESEQKSWQGQQLLFIFKFQANNKNGQVSALTDCVFKTYFKTAYQTRTNFTKSSVVSPHYLIGHCPLKLISSDTLPVFLKVLSTLNSSFLFSFRVKLGRDRVCISRVFEIHRTLLGYLKHCWTRTSTG